MDLERQGSLWDGDDTRAGGEDELEPETTLEREEKTSSNTSGE